MVTLTKSEDRKLVLPKLLTDAEDKALYARCIADGWTDPVVEEAKKVAEEKAVLAKKEADELAELAILEAEEAAAKAEQDEEPKVKEVKKAAK